MFCTAQISIKASVQGHILLNYFIYLLFIYLFSVFINIFLSIFVY